MKRKETDHKQAKNREKQNPGPEPERVKINKPWEDAVNDALKKKRPAKGWPKPKDQK